MGKKRPNLTTNERNALAQFLFQHSVDGDPPHGRYAEAATKWGVNRSITYRIWKAAKEQLHQGIPIFLSSKKPGCVKARKLTLDYAQLFDCSPMARSTIRRLATYLSENHFKVGKSTVHRWIQRRLLRPHTNAIKPDLTADNKLLRLKFTLNHIHLDRILGVLKFKSMENIIHVDEKWFYITNTTQRYYMAPEETEVHRTCKSKRYISKVMFICAVGRPIFAPTGEVVWDGKVGIFPLTTQEPAQRASKNRPRGTLETKAIQSVTKDVYKDCLINQVIPAIKEKWPTCVPKNIIIQQDNAKPHITDNDPDFRMHASSHGFNIILTNQPSNSPDTNINDLGWFRALQSLQASTASYTVDQLVKAVEVSFINLSPSTLNKVFLSLQCCMIEILRVRGQNNYKLPHMGKDRMIRENRLPQDLEVEEDLVRDCIQYLMDAGEDFEGSLMTDLA